MIGSPRIVLKNTFFDAIPRSLEEAAWIDGGRAAIRSEAREEMRIQLYRRERYQLLPAPFQRGQANHLTPSTLRCLIHIKGCADRT